MFENSYSSLNYYIHIHNYMILFTKEYNRLYSKCWKNCIFGLWHEITHILSIVHVFSHWESLDDYGSNSCCILF